MLEGTVVPDHAMKVYRGVQEQIHVFITSTWKVIA
jgi:hypothetical protein